MSKPLVLLQVLAIHVSHLHTKDVIYCLLLSSAANDSPPCTCSQKPLHSLQTKEQILRGKRHGDKTNHKTKEVAKEKHIIKQQNQRLNTGKTTKKKHTHDTKQQLFDHLSPPQCFGRPPRSTMAVRIGRRGLGWANAKALGVHVKTSGVNQNLRKSLHKKPSKSNPLFEA